VFPDNIVYRHLPGISFAKKILLVAETITTPYVCISPDDDYLLESSVRAGAHFLNNNLDFVSVQGKYLKFELIDSQIVFSPKYSAAASNYLVTNEDICSRVIRASNSKMHQILSLHRKDAFVSSYRASSDISTTQIIEFTIPIIPMCYGKHKVFSLLWMVRDDTKFHRPDAYYNDIPPIKWKYILLSYYRGYQQRIHQIQLFLKSGDGQLFKNRLGTEMSQLISDGKEIDKIFNAALSSLKKSILGEGIKVTLKIIIKLFIPDWVLNFFKKNKQFNMWVASTQIFVQMMLLIRFVFRCYRSQKFIIILTSRCTR
jgi:glycosyltransferase domain-containing protein